MTAIAHWACWMFLLQAQEPAAGRKDTFGNPLPPGAIARMGDIRFRHDSAIRQGVFSPDGATLYTGSVDETIRGWDVSTGQEKLRLKANSGWVFGIALSPDGKTLASAGKDGTVRLWDLAQRSPKAVLRGHLGPVRCVSFSKDGTALYSGGEIGSIIQWDWKAEKAVRTLDGHEDDILTLVPSPDGTLLASGSKDATIRLWEVGSGTLKQVIKGHEINVNSIAFSPDGKLLASGSGWDWVPFHEKDRSVRLWDVGTGGQRFAAGGFTRSVQLVAFSADGGTVISASSDQSVRIWEVPSGKDVTPFKQPLTSWSSALLSPDLRKIVTLSHSARFWDLASGKELNPSESHTGEVHCIAYSPDRTRIATGGSDRKVRIWDASTGRHLFSLEGHQGLVTSIRYSPDGRYIASGSIEPGEVRLWEASTGKFIREQLERTSGKFLAFFKSRPVILYGEHSVQLWDFEKDEILARFRISTGGSQNVISFELMPDEKTVLFSLGNGDLAQCDMATGTRSGEFALGKSGATYSSWVPFGLSPDGGLLVSAGHGAIKFWDVPTRKELRSVPLDKVSYYASISFSPDGRWFTTLAHDKSVRVWESYTGTEAFRIATITEPRTVVFAPDGRSVTTGGWYGDVLCWDLSPWSHGRVKPAKPDLGALWRLLSEKDGEEAYTALWSFPLEGAAFLSRELTRTGPAPERIRALVKNLEDADIEVRETASRDLLDLGPDAESMLVEAADLAASAEAKARLRLILEHITSALPKSREVLRRLRAVQALELMDSKESKAALGLVASSAPNERVRREAARSLERLRRK